MIMKMNEASVGQCSTSPERYAAAIDDLRSRMGWTTKAQARTAVRTAIAAVADANVRQVLRPLVELVLFNIVAWPDDPSEGDTTGAL